MLQFFFIVPRLQWEKPILGVPPAQGTSVRPSLISPFFKYSMYILAAFRDGQDWLVLGVILFAHFDKHIKPVGKRGGHFWTAFSTPPNVGVRGNENEHTKDSWE